ncbi:MAG: V-type ATP synthase subunit F [Clostridia bacterium]|nr:V-type ATP synthase subunit F [Clostridia bacterium]
MRYYLLSDNIDTLTGMRLVGIEGEIINDAATLSKRLDALTRDPDIAVILLTDTVNNMCKEKLINIKLNYKQPLIVVIPDRHGHGSLSDSITSYVKDAVGLKI